MSDKQLPSKVVEDENLSSQIEISEPKLGAVMTSETLAGHAQEIVDEMEVKRENDDTIISGENVTS